MTGQCARGPKHLFLPGQESPTCRDTYGRNAATAKEVTCRACLTAIRKVSASWRQFEAHQVGQIEDWLRGKDAVALILADTRGSGVVETRTPSTMRWAQQRLRTPAARMSGDGTRMEVKGATLLVARTLCAFAGDNPVENVQPALRVPEKNAGDSTTAPD